MPSSKLSPQSSPARRFAILLLILLIPFGLLVSCWPSLRYTLSHLTGEEALIEQAKGVGALLLLKLTTHPPETAPMTPMRNAGVSPYGINTFLEQEADERQVERSLQMISAAGFDWIRQEFPWEDIEIAGKGDFWDPRWDKSTWDKYDRIVELAAQYDLEVIARLDNPPAWSREMGNAPGWTMAPPDDFEDYGDFVYTVAKRYQGRVRYYQIWNEPNIYPEWGDQPADAAGYVALLKLAYARAKEADPSCMIIAAGLAQTTEETPPEFGPRNVSDLSYLEQMYQAGAQGHFDIMGAQVYGLWTGPYDYRLSRDRSNFSRVQMLRGIMVQYGDADKPIWATEVGWNALPEDFSGPANYGRVNEEQQGLYSVEAYQRAAQEWPWMGVMNYWFFRRPSEAEKDQPWYYFRMVEPDFRPLPVYAALAEQAQQTPVIYRGYHQEDHWALNYTGPWALVHDERAVLGGYAEMQPGSSVSFSFQGASLALCLGDPSQVDSLLLSIDGRLVRPHRASDDGLVTVARFASVGKHQVALYVQGGMVGLDGLVVSYKKTGWSWLVGLCGALLLSGLLIWLRRRQRVG